MGRTNACCGGVGRVEIRIPRLCCSLLSTGSSLYTLADLWSPDTCVRGVRSQLGLRAYCQLESGSTPRDPILPLTVSCFLNQRFAIDRRCPSRAFALQARRSESASAPDSPLTGKPWKLSKNEFVLLLPVLKSTKIMRIYRLYFQRSVARPQAGDRK